MVLTVTINPLLEHRFVFDSFQIGKNNRANREYYYSGGKGINVSRQLNKLGIKNQALLFAGGNNGKILRKLLVDESIDFSIVNTKNETRIASVIQDEQSGKVTTCFGLNSELYQNEVDEFKSRLEKTIVNASIVVFSGSSPGSIADELFPFGIELANSLDKIVVLDTYGNHLSKCLDKSPMVAHNNVSEIENSLEIKLPNIQDKIDVLKSFYKKGIKLSFLTDGKNDIYASKYDFIHKIEVPEVDETDSTGSGDSFVAGITYGLEKALVFDEFSKVAVALGAVNATRWDSANVDMIDAQKFIDKIKIDPIGKKMKLIDDSPTIY